MNCILLETNIGLGRKITGRSGRLLVRKDVDPLVVVVEVAVALDIAFAGDGSGSGDAGRFVLPHVPVLFSVHLLPLGLVASSRLGL